VAGNAETVTFQGRARHIHSYLQDFLFRSDRVRMPAKLLSGGERNRLLLARLFLQPANVLVMDEPTNDLDAETLELLEELLIDYTGTLLLVSHDREFLDHVVTGTLVFEGEGQVNEYIGGYEDWLRQRKIAEAARIAAEAQARDAQNAPRGKSERPRKFLNREQRELDELPALLEQLEAEHTEVTERLAKPETYTEAPEVVSELKARLADIEARTQRAFSRWEELEALRVACEQG
jgi:ATP-binding cassette subfamily F protein uup